MQYDVVDRIRDAILNGEFLPNERLVEADLIAKYQVGRAAVRMALAELEKEYLVVREPNRGARVRAISLEEAIEITEVRALLEVLVAQKAAERVTAQQMDKLRAIIDQMTKAQANADLSQYSQLNRTLHKRLYDIAGHETAKRMIVNLRAQIVRYQFRASLMPGRTDVSLAEHQGIVDAVCAKDPVAAGAAMQKHMTSVTETLRKMPKQGLY